MSGNEIAKKTPSVKASVGGLARWRPADDPDLAAARQELRVAVMEDAIRELVASAPPLTDEQKQRLSVLFSPVPTAEAAGL